MTQLTNKIAISFENLKQFLLDNTTFSEDVQIFEDDSVQVAFWCKSFGESWSICFQNGDMNGSHKGTPVWTNDGANSGLDDLLEILIERKEFQCLIDSTAYHKYEVLKEFINDFIADYAEKTSPEKYFID